MSKKQKEYATEAGMESVEQALSKTEQFIENNQKIITVVILAIIIIVGGYWGIKNLYFEPKITEAQEAMFPAQNYFERDSFKLALNGDGMNAGFLEISKEYSMTKPGKLAKYYAGVSYLKLGNYDEAINFLSDFSSKDELLNANAVGTLGDAYMEKGEVDKAISSYKEAANVENKVIAPKFLFKLGMAYEKQKNVDEAINAYKEIKDKYKASFYGRSIDKYITRLEISKK